jgi:hypothetical protein
MTPPAAGQRRATAGDVTVSDLVSEALRDRLPDDACGAPFSMVTYGRGNAKVHHEPADLKAALEAEDRMRVR